MKAIVMEAFGGKEVLQVREVPRPVPQEGEVLIRVHNAGVNPVDWKIREGWLNKRGDPHRFPLIPGWDVAGVIEQVSKGVTGFGVGDAVFACIRRPIIQWGGYAEYVAFQAQDVVKKPASLSFAQAASLPLVSLTAWQALFDAGKLRANQTVLVLGGSGAVGAMAVQFAKGVGARVYATASPKKHAFVKELGADVCIDYSGDVAGTLRAECPSGVDLVFDGVGAQAFSSGLKCVKSGGHIVSLLERLSTEDAKRLKITGSYVSVLPNGKQLQKIATLLEKGKVVPLPIRVLPLEQAAEAQEMLRAGEVFGKLVLQLYTEVNA